jgi:hypothetical protein
MFDGRRVQERQGVTLEGREAPRGVTWSDLQLSGAYATKTNKLQERGAQRRNRTVVISAQTSEVTD